MVSNFLYRVINSRIVFIVVLVGAFIMFCFGQVANAESAISGMEAYVLYMNSKSSLIYWIACMVIGACYPVNDIYVILRDGRKKWVMKEILYLIGQVLILNLCVLIVLVMNMRIGDLQEWSMTSIMMMNNQSLHGAHLGAINDITGWIMMYTPTKLCLLTFLLRCLCGIIVGILCMIFNMKRKLVYGVFLVSILYYLPEFVLRIFGHTSGLASAITDLFGMGMFDNISIAFYDKRYSLGFVFCWYVLIIICLNMLIIDESKKIEVF